MIYVNKIETKEMYNKRFSLDRFCFGVPNVALKNYNLSEKLSVINH